MNATLKKLFIIFLLIFTPIFIITNVRTLNNIKIINFTFDEIKYKNYLLETKQSLPCLFIQQPLILNTNARYSSI